MTRVAIVGYGNIGRYAVEAVKAAPDLQLAGIVRRSLGVTSPPELAGISIATKIEELDAVDVALLTVPTRRVPELAGQILARGINTVDSFDLHGADLVTHRRAASKVALKNQAVAVVAAGWDPGTDSILRALMEMMTPYGLTFTNFGPGMSMGHSVAVKAIAGVEDALSMTIPAGSGVHRRLVYVQLAPGVALADVEALIKEDAYFSKDETHVYEVESVNRVKDLGHGVLMERVGTSGQTANQQLRWEMRINNPALTAQVMVASARASMRQTPGAYTLLEIPLADYFSGNSDELIERLM